MRKLRFAAAMRFVPEQIHGTAAGLKQQLHCPLLFNVAVRRGSITYVTLACNAECSCLGTAIQTVLVAVHSPLG